ncbi:SGNH/GDSL hydrolase family protein [Nakamurella deserti]|uniref:SGNH/GDSL hydrolase family protein n=1 Tax=Nakamurella deserti TaxID=2164074 RepID=UPI001300B91A|nr:SGNH/GDSL hydrolase family protein [Nakamurella deserti]
MARDTRPAVAPAAASAPDATLTGRVTRALAARTAVTLAAGVGVAVGTGSAAWKGLEHQARLAAERIGLAAEPPPRRDGVYLPDGRFRRLPTVPRNLSRLRLAMLGDSSSAGFGAADEDFLPGVMLARDLSARLYRPVQLSTHAVVGTGAADLARQVEAALLDGVDVAVVIVGPNDVRDRVAPAESVRALAAAVARLRTHDVVVVVGTCPDLGVITPIPAPLRQLAGYWSRSLAARQEQAVHRAGGLAVPIGRWVSPGFVGHPELFSPDLFHPSGEGYARAVAVLSPAVLTGLGSAVSAAVAAVPEFPASRLPDGHRSADAGGGRSG